MGNLNEIYCNVMINFLIKEDELKNKVSEFINSLRPAYEAGIITEDELSEKGKAFVFQYMDIEIWNEDFMKCLSKRRGDVIFK